MESPKGNWDKVYVELGGEEEICLSRWPSCDPASSPHRLQRQTTWRPVWCLCCRFM